ncbi:MAG: polysaccharide biosynthesis protein [Exiguobacterium sp.]|uniref:putative polysaccharide biosynthesis protein n=1 Tax=Exiguobacterium alkaliphilum TaxID=1428684 RepID=UPI0029C1968E|nr:polysaccharide biosynthesis protein [Exiguobacterium sp.]MDX5426041.1 polysaccharide biosynthesis protein [Exiguobacterium sp.]MDX6773435.1 polysaccharide biosynthesis protein [Exiguobacterium sp.]
MSSSVKQDSGRESFVRGTLLLSAGNLISRMLGLLYTFPFQAMVGIAGVTLYQAAYTYYALMIAISTAGIPVAVSKFIAKYNALGEYGTSQRLFRQGMKLMLATGVVAFLILFFAAPWLSELMVRNSDNNQQYVDSLTLVTRSVSFALLLIPAMSMVRGYFQGHQDMAPTAISQVIEQIVRILFLLSGTMLVLFVLADSELIRPLADTLGGTGAVETTELNGLKVLAVTIATFSAFIGAIGSIVVLAIYWRKRKLIHTNTENPEGTPVRSMKSLLLELLSYSIPIVMVGLSTPLYQFVDQLTMVNTLLNSGKTVSEATSAFGFLTGNAHKIVLIPVSIAASVSMATIPLVTRSFTHGDMTKVRNQVNHIFQVSFFVTIPAVIGLVALAEPLFGTLFPRDREGWVYLLHYAPSAFFLAYYSVAAAILQGINRQYFTIFATAMGLLAKVVLNVPFVYLLGGIGAGYATIAGYIVAIVLMVWKIQRALQFPYKQLLRRTMLMFAMGAVMFIVVYGSLFVTLNQEPSWGNDILATFVGFGLGLIVYGYLGWRSHLAGKLLGKRFEYRRKA